MGALSLRAEVSRFASVLGPGARIDGMGNAIASVGWETSFVLPVQQILEARSSILSIHKVGDSRESHSIL